MSLPESYRVQDGCWNCKHEVDADMPVMPDLCCKKHHVDSIHPSGICEHHEKEDEG